MQHAVIENTVLHTGLMAAMGWLYLRQAVGGIKKTTVRRHLVQERNYSRKTGLHFSAVAIQVFVIMS